MPTGTKPDLGGVRRRWIQFIAGVARDGSIEIIDQRCTKSACAGRGGESFTATSFDENRFVGECPARGDGCVSCRA